LHQQPRYRSQSGSTRSLMFTSPNAGFSLLILNSFSVKLVQILVLEKRNARPGRVPAEGLHNDLFFEQEIFNFFIVGGTIFTNN